MFKINFLKATLKSSKHHITGKQRGKVTLKTLKINSAVIHETNVVVLLGITTWRSVNTMKIFAVLLISNYMIYVELENTYPQKKLGYYVLFL